ncbi:helix-turn-helix domain-containing protein [Pelomonas sp. Root1444]|uniref:helix-turn-helix domain-containing protein n=1 Tax=Pelomonas sp. Root1444 TaxID=1736464 RepID=UPI0007028624|nr:helix-turn-helix domain-containing protein [Pelomonas sp. Root1444]KQY83732.1 hypothetical protein ASD35_24230 [Pelomonas sp. Root1444]
MSRPRALPTVIEAVEFRRDAYGLDCRQWAAVLGMAPSHYSEFVNGKRPLPKRAMTNAFAYGVPAEALFQTHPTKGASDIDRRLAQIGKRLKTIPSQGT